jgi:hypothetical protein
VQPPSPALGPGPASDSESGLRLSSELSPSALSRAERSAASTAQRARVSAGGGTACQRGKGGRCKDMHFARRRGRGGDAGCGWAVLAPPGQARTRRGEAGRAGMRCDAGRGGATGRGGQGKGAAERGGSARQGSGEAGWGAAAEREHAPPYSARADSAKSVWKNQTDSVLLFLCGLQ